MIMIRLVTLCHQRYCYTVTDYIPHTIHFKLCHLFCTWMFVPLNLRHLLLPLLPHKHTVTTLHFYSPPPAFTVFDNIFYIFLFCVSPNYLSRIDDFYYFCLLTFLVVLHVVDLLPLLPFL